jgi:hypothetical protein
MARIIVIYVTPLWLQAYLKSLVPYLYGVRVIPCYPTVSRMYPIFVLGDFKGVVIYYFSTGFD